jgi:hypothetical protein
VLLQGFFRETLQRAGCFISTGIGNVPDGLGASRAHVWGCLRSVLPRRCSLVSSPRAWARSRRSGRALRLALVRPSPSLRGTEGEVSTTPIGRVADCGFLVELLSGNSSGRPCPVR